MCGHNPFGAAVSIEKGDCYTKRPTGQYLYPVCPGQRHTDSHVLLRSFQGVQSTILRGDCCFSGLDQLALFAVPSYLLTDALRLARETPEVTALGNLICSQLSSRLDVLTNPSPELKEALSIGIFGRARETEKPGG